MNEETIIWEKPLYSLKLIRGQSGKYGWEIKITGPDLSQIKKEIEETNTWCHTAVSEFKKDQWDVRKKEKK